MDLIQFGSYIPEAPSKYDVTVTDLDSSSTGRSETGVLQRERVRGGDNPIYKIALEWNNISQSSMEGILQAVKPASVSTVFYFGSNVTANMYASDKKITLVTQLGSVPKWNISFNMIQY